MIKPLKSQDWLEIFENAIAYIVVFAMLVYGLGKWVQFGEAHKINKAVSELSGMQLMWAFYAYSKTFVLIIGFLEVAGGILILFKKTRLIGCFLTSTILVNIILQDIFYGIPFGALKAAILYQSLLCIILWINRIRVMTAFKALLTTIPKNEQLAQILLKLLISFALFIIFRVMEYYITIVW